MNFTRETVILFWLLVATAVTAAVAWPGDHSASLSVIIITLGIAAFKMHLIAYKFMEVSTAPLSLRIFITGWLIIVTATLLGIYSLGGQ